MTRLLFHSVLIAAAAGSVLLTSACGGSNSSASATSQSSEKDPSEMLTVGSTAPNFTAQDDRGQTVKLADFSGKKNVVLIFYPMNETPGCTAQLCTARDDWKKYQEAGVQVFGVNTADQESHRKFAENHNFPFPLLADTEGAIVKDFGARGLMGMVKRTVYVIGKDGRILFAERGMPSTQTILAAIPQPTS